MKLINDLKIKNRYYNNSQTINIIKMKISIDLNDVLRAYTAQFASYYKKGIDREFDIDTVDVWTNDLIQIFPFESRKEYLNFLYDDYVFEIFGAADKTHKNIGSRFSDWCVDLENLDSIPEITLVSTGEYNKSIGSTYFFLSKLAVQVPTVKLYLKEHNIWDECDVLITANPDLLLLKPEGKISVKIKTSYNEEDESDFTYDGFINLLDDDKFLNNINEKKKQND